MSETAALAHNLACLIGAALTAVGVCTLERLFGPDHVRRGEIEMLLDLRLARVLPLPHLGDRGSLLAMLRDFARDRPLALYTTGEPACLVSRRDGSEPPGPAEARFVEIHRQRLATGDLVFDARCGTLIPALTRDGELRAALIVGGRSPVAVNDETHATLRHIAGLMACVNDLRDTLVPDGTAAGLASRRNGAKPLHVVRTTKP
jgi:hypothetical protein